MPDVLGQAHALEIQHIRPGERAGAARPGDFILTHGGEFFSQLIRVGQQLRFHGADNQYTFWNHTALVVSDDGAIIEALGNGVVRRSLADYDPTQYTIVRVDASDRDRLEEVDFAQRCVGAPYGWLTIASIALSLLTGAKISFGFDGQMICSGLVARALERTTAIFKHEPSHIMPAELAKAYSVQPPPKGTPKGVRAKRDRRAPLDQVATERWPETEILPSDAIDHTEVRLLDSLERLQADDTVGDARARLAAQPGRAVVVSRRHPDAPPGARPTWYYAFNRTEMRAIEAFSSEVSLLHALNLHENTSTVAATTARAAVDEISQRRLAPGGTRSAVIVDPAGVPLQVAILERSNPGFGLGAAGPGAGGGSDQPETTPPGPSWDPGAAEPPLAGSWRSEEMDQMEASEETIAPPQAEVRRSAPPPAMNGGDRGPKAKPSDALRPVKLSAYGRIDGPDRTTVGLWFATTVGLSAEAQPGVAGGPMPVPGHDYLLDVQVSADGFELRQGEQWRHVLQVTVAQRYPTFTLHLRASATTTEVDYRRIEAKYAVDGQPIGFALRSVAVVSDPAKLNLVAAQPQDSGVHFSLPTGDANPDLTVTITVTKPEIGRLKWQFDVDPARSAAKPPSPAVYRNIGTNAEGFAVGLMNNMGAREQKDGIYQYLVGTGRDIAAHVPPEFWSILRTVAAEVAPRPPSVLLLTNEPHVPWELARMDPPLDPASPPFLAAQATIGRWVFTQGSDGPSLPPPHTASAKRIAVIAGDYGLQSGVPQLVEAKKEADALVGTYHATVINAAMGELLTKLVTPGADIFHFACHGQVNFDPSSTSTGLILSDGQALAALQVNGLTFTNAPFVFLNACQVGQGQTSLGDYAGMAEAFLRAGAAGVVAPLWRIDDTVARTVALDFYAEALNDPWVPAAEILRRQRGNLQTSAVAQSGTWVAYVYFGHPLMQFAH